MQSRNDATSDSWIGHSLIVQRSNWLESWAEFSSIVPEFAEVIQDRLIASEYHVLATLHADGSQRVNGTNLLFEGDDLVIGCMPKASGRSGVASETFARTVSLH